MWILGLKGLTNNVNIQIIIASFQKLKFAEVEALHAQQWPSYLNLQSQCESLCSSGSISYITSSSGKRNLPGH